MVVNNRSSDAIITMHRSSLRVGLPLKADEGAGHNEFECWSKVILVWWEEEDNQVTNVQNVHRWLNKIPLTHPSTYDAILDEIWFSQKKKVYTWFHKFIQPGHIFQRIFTHSYIQWCQKPGGQKHVIYLLTRGGGGFSLCHHVTMYSRRCVLD